MTAVVLLQFGKGAEAGAMMGTSGASQNIFATSSKGNIVSKATTVMAILFVVNSLVLTKMMSQRQNSSLMDNEERVIELQKEQPAAAKPVEETKPAKNDK